MWSANLVKSARKEGRIADDYLMKTVIDVSIGLSFLYCFLLVLARSSSTVSLQYVLSAAKTVLPP